jgi:para-nitrobenzyl esterase
MSAADGWTRRGAIGSALALGAIGAQARANSPMRRTRDTIVTPLGAYRGSEGQFLGIRYARAERFRAPLPTTAAEQFEPGGGTFGPVCPQGGDRYLPQSEDCLFLNVWMPPAARAELTAIRLKRSRPIRNLRLPVMLYIHGGAYSNGSVTDPLNDGANLAAQGGVVVVTVNHRLNVFGYLYQPDRFPDSGNAGQLDIIAALHWVKRNIASFGGDPANVTVFGQSGGGAKIATMMAMPEADGLFAKAITMSGQQVTASGPLNASKRTAAFLAKLGEGVDPATAPVADLVAALGATDPVLGGGLYMGPVLDMRHLVRHPFWPDAPPQSRAIPMLLGNTVSETRAFYAPEGRQLAGLDFGNLAARIAPEMRIDIEPHWVVAQFRERYPLAQPLELFHRIVTAARSWRGQVEEAEARARQGTHNTWVYQLDFEDAKHTDDIGLSFGTVPETTPAQKDMSATVMGAFVRFARTGDPGWAPYDLTRRTTMVFDTVSRPVDNPRAWERELFARVPYIQPGS